MKEFIEDLSFSNIVNIIQGETIKGADVLNSIALEMESVDKKIQDLERELSRSKSRKGGLIEGSKKVIQHLQLETPLYVHRQGYTVIVEDESIYITKNII
jgi:predicted transcriptional regulator